jgi:hypothetical protein
MPFMIPKYGNTTDVTDSSLPLPFQKNDYVTKKSIVNLGNLFFYSIGLLIVELVLVFIRMFLDTIKVQ